MIFFKDTQKTPAAHYPVGGKAENLYRLKGAGFEVPRWVVIPATELVNRLPFGYAEMDAAELLPYIEDADIPESTLRQITDYFPENMFLAVRSSAIGEDGRDHSFAGQFESYLYVGKRQLEHYIKKVWASAFAERVSTYTAHHGLASVRQLAVVIQAMVPAEVSGVAFGLNPITGNLQENVINAVYGLGEGLVSGLLDADQFIVNSREISAQLAVKTQRLTLDWNGGGGTVLEEVDAALHAQPALTPDQVLAISELLDKGQQVYGYPLDMEFALADEVLYVLQARAVTQQAALPDTGGDHVIWDNSNIIESYPGVTTPLTFSFVSKSYAGAYTLFCAYLGVRNKTIRRHAQVFANTLGLIKGRIYYNLKTWYHMLALLPGYSINARYMEQMMGVKETFDIPADYRLSKLSAWWAIVTMAVRMVWRFITLSWVRKKFFRLLNRTISEYKALNLQQQDAQGLMRLYLEFERRLLNEWKAPLLNDFFAMIAFGSLEKQVKKLVGEQHPNLHNDLLCGSADIISTQPIHRCLAIASEIQRTEGIRKLFLHDDAEAIWQRLQGSDTGAEKELRETIASYLDEFGERCVGELKLETISYAQNPAKFIQLIQSYVKGGITSEAMNSEVEEKLRTDAEQTVAELLKGKRIQQWKFNWLLGITRKLVSARENLRYERTRAFGVVRQLVSQIGNRFHADGIINDARDIFYLTMEEIFAYIEGRSVTADVKALVALRQTEFAGYRAQDAPPERFATYGTVYHTNTYASLLGEEPLVGELKGIGCCPGRVRAKVRVVLDPQEVGTLDGDILVTRSTDPGWTTLFPSASGILVERGSLLSHSAIVSREMGKPCIVGITGLLKVLKTGDLVEMDGSTGEIKRIG